MNACQIAVFEEEKSRVGHWSAVLEFLGYQAEVVSPQVARALDLSRPPEWLAVLTGRLSPDGELGSSLRALIQRHPGIPLVVAENPEGWDGLTDLAAAAGTQCWRVDQLVGYRHLADILHRACLHRANTRSDAIGAHFGPGGRSPAITRVRRLVEQVAPYDTTVLITGESGTGKERVARHLHELSTRASRAFVPVNCGAIPAELLESELFGHEKGAFTGALTRRQGAFELANRGTLFLDEVAEMTPATQAKLLRVLQERTFRTLGGQREQSVDIRVVAATNVDPPEAVRQGKLREDLFYRLNVFAIELPPLRDRKEDIPLLTQAFVREFAQRNNRPVVGVSDRALRMLDQYHWPGNVRELRNVMERAVIVSRGDMIEPGDLPQLMPVTPPAPAAEGPVLTAGTTVDEAERQLIEITLTHTGGNKTRAAEMLGISLKTLHNKLNRMKEDSAGQDA